MQPRHSRLQSIEIQFLLAVTTMGSLLVVAIGVQVPRNTALVVSREKGDFVNVIQTPLAAQGAHGRQAEVQLCAPRPSLLRRKSTRTEAAVPALAAGFAEQQPNVSTMECPHSFSSGVAYRRQCQGQPYKLRPHS